MFGKKDNQSNERVIYKTKPNLIFGCKKAIIGIVLLIFVLSISGYIIQFIGKMQVYLISQIKLPLTRYTAIAVFVVILVIILFIIWQIIGWYSKEYILTDSKIIVKSGVFLNRKNYMPYATIQDINTSQSIFSKLFNVGSISVFSAYDNNQISIENVSNPSEVEEIIFSNMSRGRSYQDPRPDYYRNPQEDYRRPNPQNYYNDSNQEYYPPPNQNHRTDDYYDDVVITPIHQEEQYQRRQYEYYPEDLESNNVQRPKYEYEPYDESLEQNINRAMTNEYENDSYHNQRREEYSYKDNNRYDNSQREYHDDGYYGNTQREYQYDDFDAKDSKPEKNVDESSEKVIKRHFDKFKK
ncbi:MAG: PH domain-containing protein [Methanobrevibacter sp.]|nr:PH domain-containing protein [Methanobrevibacter sp.]